MNTAAISFLLLAAIAVTTSHARADATVTVCGKDVWPGDPRTDLSEALQAGGQINFACSGVIEFTMTHALTKDMQIDGGGRITLDGKGHRMFGLGISGAYVSLSRIRIEGGGLPAGSIPGSVIVGEGFVSLLEGTSIRNSDRPIWLLAGDLKLQNAWIADNIGPVLIVSEGALAISQGTRLTDNKGQLIETGPLTSVHIQDAQFLRNGHSVFGGTRATNCEVTITKSWFADNADAENGGAILSQCDLAMEETQFERNRSGGDGGAIYLTNGANVSMRKVQFRENSAGGSGGAVAGIWDLQRRGDLRIRQGRFEGNSAAHAGGALLAGEARLLEISGSGFIGNAAGTAGGAVYARQSALNASGSLFRKNRAHSGAAIQALCMPAMGRIANSIIAENTSATTGGAYFGGNMHFLNATMVDNGNTPVQHGEACGALSAIEFANSILHGAWSGICGGADGQRTFKDLGHNLQYPYESCGASIPVAYPLLGPFFAPLRPISPAGSAGDNELCRAPPINGRDFFGTHRPQGTACSIGAVEGDLSTLIARSLKRRRGRD